MESSVGCDPFTANSNYIAISNNRATAELQHSAVTVEADIMSAIVYLHEHAIPAALAMLPMKMTSPAAEAMVLAICLQESRCESRKQLNGPARGFPQFEVNGVRGVMQHRASRPYALNVLEHMVYPTDAKEVQQALTDNDILAVVFARLLLWTHPASLPLEGEEDKSWAYYLSLWRPGRPHRETWGEFYRQGWGITKGDK